MAKRPAKSDSPHLHSPIRSGSSTEGTLEAAERYPQGKLTREQEERGSDVPPTIIPFRSEQAQAAGKPAAPSIDT